MFGSYNPEMCKFCSVWCPNRPCEVTVVTNNIGTTDNPE